MFGILGAGAIATAIAVPMSCFNEKDPVTDSFETDPWSKILYYANQGIDKLHNVYAKDCEDNKEFKGTLIGLERNVYINGLDSPHKVKVIAEEQDAIGENSVSLTFQFENLISDNEGNCLLAKWDTRTGDNYWDSLLLKNLNSLEDVTWFKSDETTSELKSSVYQMIISDVRNEGLTENNAIKEVSRSVSVKENAWGVKIQQTRIFCPNLANLFDESILSPEEPYYVDEGSQYEYYVKEIGSGNLSDSYECFGLKDLNGQKKPYWLTTPGKPNGSTASVRGAWYIINDDTSQKANERYVTDKKGIAPCFCI